MISVWALQLVRGGGLVFDWISALILHSKGLNHFLCGRAWLSDYHHILAMLPPNQLLWAPPSLRLICNSHSKPWWWRARLMTIHQETVMRGVLKMMHITEIRPNSRPLFWHLRGETEWIVVFPAGWLTSWYTVMRLLESRKQLWHSFNGSASNCG